MASKEAPEPPATEPTAEDVPKPAPKESAKPAPKESSKPSSKESSKPAPKESSKPAAKESSKPAAKEAAKPSSKESSKPASKESSKPAAKEAAKPAAKEAAKEPAAPPPSKDIWGDYVAGSPYVEKHFGAGDPHLLFVGAEKSGKSTLQNMFFGKSDEPLPTLALNYQSCNIKVSNRSITLHLWELGGGLQLESILDTTVTSETQPGFVIFICMDLMSPTSILEGGEWLDHIQSRFGDTKRAVFFVGTKYDMFEAKDGRERELVSRGLRAIAAQHNAGVIFTSNRQDALVNRFKNVIKYVAIANSKVREKVVTGAVIVGPGEDPEAKNDMEAVATLMNMMREQSEDEKEKLDRDTVNPAENPQFAEEEIDSLRAARREELDEKKKAKAAEDTAAARKARK